MYQLEQWLTQLSLDRPAKSLKKTLSNGTLVAEIIFKYRPELRNPGQLYDSEALDKKQSNWDFINKKLAQIENYVQPSNYGALIDSVVRMRADGDAQYALLKSFYECFTGRTLRQPVIKHELRDRRPPKEVKKSVSQVQLLEQNLKAKLVQQQQ